jgi:hypothetical protein
LHSPGDDTGTDQLDGVSATEEKVALLNEEAGVDSCWISARLALVLVVATPRDGTHFDDADLILARAELVTPEALPSFDLANQLIE